MAFTPSSWRRVVIVIACSLLPSIAIAQLTRLDFTGSVTSVQDPTNFFSGDVQVGSLFSSSFWQSGPGTQFVSSGPGSFYAASHFGFFASTSVGSLPAVVIDHNVVGPFTDIETASGLSGGTDYIVFNAIYPFLNGLDRMWVQSIDLSGPFGTIPDGALQNDWTATAASGIFPSHTFSIELWDIVFDSPNSWHTEQSDQTPSIQGVIDGVQVSHLEAVPEPSSYEVIACVVLMTGALMRRRRS